MGVFWRILFIEIVLLVYSLGYSWIVEGATPLELFWYALRIAALIFIIIVFMMISLKSFLTRKIIAPLEAIAKANEEIGGDISRAGEINIPLNEATPREIHSIISSRESMLKRITDVSDERLHLVNFIKETFGKYLSTKVVDEILNSSDGRSIGGTRREVTVLMSDLRGFSSLSESRVPKHMVELLNQYLEKMSRIILKYDGIIDEIVGDAILAVFGAPHAHDNDPERAVACAVEMQNCLKELNKDIATSDHPPLEMGIGINTGPVIVGNIGSELRMKYGIVGATVNRASRIESNSIGGDVLVGHTTFSHIRSIIQADPPKTVMMKGMKKPLVFYAIKSIQTREWGKITLESFHEQATMIDLQIPCQYWMIHNKKVDILPILGETHSTDGRRMKVITRRPIPPLTDLKFKLNFCLDAHCFEPMYAKCLSSEKKGRLNTSLLQLTSMEDEDRKILGQWISEISQ